VKKIGILVLTALAAWGCKKGSTSKPPAASPFEYRKTTIDDSTYQGNLYNVPRNPSIEIFFSQPINKSTVTNGIDFTGGPGAVSLNFSYPNDSSLVIRPASPLNPLTSYLLIVSSNLTSTANLPLNTTVRINFITAIDSTDKFPRISDSALLTLAEQQTFNYFWSNADPASGMAKERATQSQVTTGGSGFGIMAMLAAVQRNFITRTDALNRITTIVNFLTNKATTYHGAFPHWMNGATGATIPFSAQDNGGDIVETAYMIQGLLCARQFFNSTTDPSESSLRTAINNIYDHVNWNWYRQNGQNVLYWNWSPQYNFAINVKVQGWDEALITYVLAASSNTDSFTIPKAVYDQGWALNGSMKNGNSY
jgi:hypothetical protein